MLKTTELRHFNKYLQDLMHCVDTRLSVPNKVSLIKTSARVFQLLENLYAPISYDKGKHVLNVLYLPVKTI